MKSYMLCRKNIHSACIILFDDQWQIVVGRSGTEMLTNEAGDVTRYWTYRCKLFTSLELVINLEQISFHVLWICHKCAVCTRKNFLRLCSKASLFDKKIQGFFYMVYYLSIN